MAERITVSHGDTITKILKTRRNLNDHDIHVLLPKIRKANPHISDLNRIHAGESLLIPWAPEELVLEEQIIENALIRVPKELINHRVDRTHLFIAMGGATIDSIAEKMFAGSRFQNLPLSTKRAVLIHNNPDLMKCLDTNRVPDKMPLEVTPMVLSRFDLAYWYKDRYDFINRIRGFDPVTEEMFRKQGAEETCILARLVEGLSNMGAAVGPDGVINTSASGVSGAAAAGQVTLASINALFRQIYDDAVKQFGVKVARSNTKANLTQMIKFMRAHPSYPKLMRQMKEMPGFLLPVSRSSLVPASSSTIDAVAQARHFNKNYFRTFRYWNANKYMGSIAKQLNGRVNVFNALGRHATWYIPSVFALCSIYEAPMEKKVETLFKEGFGIAGGWAGTILGAEVIGVGLVAVFALGPVGAFILIFLCGTMGGIAGNALFKWGGGKIYDAGTELGGSVYHSMDDLFGEFF
jgi:hypothetical protein